MKTKFILPIFVLFLACNSSETKVKEDYNKS